MKNDLIKILTVLLQWPYQLIAQHIFSQTWDSQTANLNQSRVIEAQTMRVSCVL